MSEKERPLFTLAEKEAAWDWLHNLAIDEHHQHAAVAIVEWQAYYDALREIANYRGDDARRLKFMAVDALTYSERMAPAEPRAANPTPLAPEGK